MGLPVLAAPPDQLTPLRQTAVAAGLVIIDFPTAGQQTTDYHVFARSVAGTPTAGCLPWGRAVRSRKAVRNLIGGLPLLR